MTIDEAIAQAREKAEEIRENLINGNNLEPYESYCNAMNERRVKKHEQIAEWLELLKWYEHGMEDIPSESGVLTKAVYSDGYNKALEDYHRLIADEIKNDPVNPYLLHLYNFNNHIKKCLTKR